jgi:hypothetical protein
MRVATASSSFLVRGTVSPTPKLDFRADSVCSTVAAAAAADLEARLEGLESEEERTSRRTGEGAEVETPAGCGVGGEAFAAAAAAAAVRATLTAAARSPLELVGCWFGPFQHFLLQLQLSHAFPATLHEQMFLPAVSQLWRHRQQNFGAAGLNGTGGERENCCSAAAALSLSSATPPFLALFSVGAA